MKVISHRHPDQSDGMVFTDIITFRPKDNLCNYLNFGDGQHIERINTVCEWMANNLSDNYAIIQCMNRMISGGWGYGKSKEGWERASKSIKQDGIISTHMYELRCFSDDAALFLLKFS